MEIQTNEKKSFFKSKMFIVPMVAIMLLGFVAAAIMFATIETTATISEALSTATVTMSFSGVPGDIITKTFDVENAANQALTMDVDWAEDSNLGGVIYTTDMVPTKTVTIAPGANTVTVQFEYDGASPLGDVNGTITLTRTGTA